MIDCTEPHQAEPHEGIEREGQEGMPGKAQL
jgi:hypothetical protein